MKNEIRAILLSTWDPAGISGVEQATDEYDSYIQPLLHAVMLGKSAHELARMLTDIETREMGLRPVTNKAEAAGRKLARLKIRQ